MIQATLACAVWVVARVLSDVRFADLQRHRRALEANLTPITPREIARQERTIAEGYVAARLAIGWEVCEWLAVAVGVASVVRWWS